MKRIFVALAVGEDLRRAAAAWENNNRHLPVRWLEGKNLHVTLVPPWREEDIDNVKDRLRMVMPTNPFIMDFNSVRFGPTTRNPRLIWAEGETPQDLIVLKKEIERALGKEPAEQAFLMHLTLARFKPEDFGRFPVKSLNDQISWQEHVSGFVLMETHLSPRGADYEILESFSL